VSPLVDVLLVNPIFKKRWNNSPFRFPPLGLGYIASILKQENYTVKIIDCTFKTEADVLNEIKKSEPQIIGFYSMYSIEKESISLAKRVRDMTGLLVVGGPLPTIEPSNFLKDFDAVIMGEGEKIMLELTRNYFNSKDFRKTSGIAYNDKGKIHYNRQSSIIKDIDSIPSPARELFDNESYKNYYERYFGHKMTSMISTRGCPYNCDFCSKPIFGDTVRLRSPKNIVDEMVSIKELGYDVIWFADDCFTISKERVIEICKEIISQNLDIRWQCLSRADTFDTEMAQHMKKAGCQRIYFGLESGDDKILKTIMKKDIRIQTAREGIKAASSADIETGAFFILGYPGESNETILNTIDFAISLPLDYVSFTLPYPIPGTGLYMKLKNSLKSKKSHGMRLINQRLEFDSEFSESKLKFAIIKAAVQFRIMKYLGRSGYKIFGHPFSWFTDKIFRVLR